MRAGEALTGSFSMIRNRPRLVLPALIPTTLIGGITCSSIFAGIPLELNYDGSFQTSLSDASGISVQAWYLPVMLVLMLLLFVADTLVSGMYPHFVVSIAGGREPGLMEALRFSYHKFWSLLGASVIAAGIVGLIASMITSLIVIPAALTGSDTGVLERVITTVISLLIGAFFYYAPASIIMENRKAVEGITVSWNVGKRNYLYTLLLLVIPSLVGSALSGLLVYLPYTFAAGKTNLLLMLIPWIIIYTFIHAWTLTIPPYAYQDLMPMNKVSD